MEHDGSNLKNFPFVSRLQHSGSGTADSAATSQKLKKDLQTVFNVLPKDMQQLLLSNPKRAALLHGSPEHTKVPGNPSLQGSIISQTDLSIFPL